MALSWVGRLHLSANPSVVRFTSKSARTPSHSFLYALLAIAFFLQSYIAQTHIHHSDSVFVGASAISNHSDKAGDEARPANPAHPVGDSDSNCPLCQMVGHASVLVVPASVAVFEMQLQRVTPVYLAIFHRDFHRIFRQQQRGPPLF